MSTIQTLAVLALAASPAQQDGSPARPERPQVSMSHARPRGATEGTMVTVSIGGAPFTTYYYADAEKPYLYPLVGPTRVEMTREFPMGPSTSWAEPRAGEAHDHPHHRSLWFAHGDLNGHDFWHGAHTRIVPEGEPELLATGDEGVLRVRNRWLDDSGGLVCTEERVMRFRGDEHQRSIDFEITLKPADDPLVFGDTKEGTMALRLRPELRLQGEVAEGHMRNAAGDEDGACWGKRAAWATTWGTVDGELVGLTLFDHPKNHAHPTWWHARDYGLFAANPFGAHDFEGGAPDTGTLVVAVGDELELRYRLVIYAGAPDFEAIEGQYAAWAGLANDR